jgi:catechol 2,3-dioxygenase-like lactoylglutathione lyase family enzyme
MRLDAFTLLCREYDEAIAYFTEKLGFTLIEDTRIDDEKRWVIVAPPASQARILLARAADETQRARVGGQAGGRVLLFLHTDDFWTDYERMRSRGVVFCEEPRDEAYGMVVVFEDLYGNRWDLVGPPRPSR